LKNFLAKSIVLSAIFFTVGFLAGSWFHRHSYDACIDSFSFVNPYFACMEEHTLDKKSYMSLRTELISYIEEQKASGNVSEVSIFFRDLEAGPTMGISERVDFVPASLLKLPNVLILMRLQEEGEVDLSKETSSYSGVRQKDDQQIKPEYEILPNTSYTILDLIFHSLVYSDNLANRLLIDYINSIDNGRNLIFEIYRDLGILEVSDSLSSAVNTKGYSTIFRLLYNSAFLNSENSEKLLDIMSKSTDTGGLRGGVPQSVKISHKFGERVVSPTENQLHDCGIIYYPENPYLLCVMTRGKNFEKLQNTISYISSEFYKEVDSRRLENKK